MIAERTLSQIRDRTDIVALISDTIKLTRRGRSWLGLCPFHKEKTPSFSVNPERGYFHCFGCKEKGGAIDFLMKLEGKSFPEAARALAERAGIEVEDTATDAERREANAARRVKEDLYAVNALAATFFEQCLRGGPGARPHALAHHAAAELARRGLPLPPQGEISPIVETLQAFRIGYAPFAWDGLTAYFQKHGISPAQAERVGLLVPRSTGSGRYDRFRHRLIFAVLDVTGRVIAFSGRALPEPSEDELRPLGLKPSQNPDEKQAKYINSPESPVYTKGEHLFGLYQARQAIRQKGEAVLVEGNFDVMALHARGLQNVVAPLGTAFTEHQARLLKRFSPSVTIVFDGDIAGKKATWAARGPCLAAGLAARAAGMPRGLDPDEMLRRSGETALVELLASAPPITQRLLDMLLRDGELEGAPLQDPAARARAAKRLIEEAGDDVERAMLRSYADQVAAALGVEDLAALLRPPAVPSPAEATRPRVGTLAHELGLAMFGTLLDFPSLLDRTDVGDGLAVLDGPVALAVVVLRGAEACSPPVLLERLPATVRDYAARRLAAPVFESEDEAAQRFRHYAKRIRSSRVGARAPEPQEIQ